MKRITKIILGIVGIISFGAWLNNPSPVWGLYPLAIIESPTTDNASNFLLWFTGMICFLVLSAESISEWVIKRRKK